MEYKRKNSRCHQNHTCFLIEFSVFLKKIAERIDYQHHADVQKNNFHYFSPAVRYLIKIKKKNRKAMLTIFMNASRFVIPVFEEA